VAGAVYGMKRRGSQVGCIPDVMQPRSSNQVWPILWGECRADALRLSSDPADVLPARAEVRQQRSGVFLGPGRQGIGFHAGTLSAGASLRKV
jgi:hypothetical protein